MPVFPELLYQLSGRDQQVTWLDPVIVRVATSTAAAQVNATFTVNTGRAFVLTSAIAAAVPGAAQNITDLSLVLQEPTGTTNVGLTGVEVTPAAGLAFQRLNFSGEVVLPPGWKVIAVGTYSAGVAANQTILTLTGILMPVGNIQRV